jgi:hypothetical protein
VQDVDFPAVTFCNPQGHDTGEYVRAIFNNFAFLEETQSEIQNTTMKSARLKEIFAPFLPVYSTKSMSYGLFVWAR